MGSSIWLLLFFFVPITIHHLVAQPIIKGDVSCTSRAELCWSCADSRNYTNGSIYQQNLISLLSSFSNTSQNQTNYGFHNSSLGQGSNKVNAIALCRGDLTLGECSSCLSDSTQILLRNCSYKTEAILWAEPCTVRYSQDLIFGIEEEHPFIYLPSPNTALNPEAYGQVLNPLLETLRDRATSGDSRKKYAAGHAFVPAPAGHADDREPIYAHAQCTPDMDKVNCSNCLNSCISAIPRCCSGKSGTRVLRPSCNIRFEYNLFYNSTADSELNISAPAPAPVTILPPKQGNKNYLPDALTRELAMFNRRDDDDEGRNPRSRRAGKEHEENEDPKEKILKRFLLGPKRPATTDQSQGKGLTSPSQTADGKGSSRPLTAVALPKSKHTPTGVLNVFNYELRTFDTPVFRTGRRLAYHQKAILDNILFAFQERSSGLMFPALFALAEELYEHGRPQFEEAQQSAVKKEKINFLESPESARVPIIALNESDWHEFHNLIGRYNSEDLVPPTLFIVSGSYVGRYLVNVQSEHPQKHKLWLVENGFVHNLWTKTNDDLKGLPPIIVNTVKNIRRTDSTLRLKFRSTPPEWIRKANGEVEYISPYHYVRIIQRKYLQPACVGYNGQPNSSIPWMKAMALEYIKKIISEDIGNTFLAAGEKTIITAYDHSDVVSSDLFLSLTRNEIDSTMACMQWMEKLENDNHYKMYVDTDVEDNAAIDRMAQADNDSFVLGHNSETDENM